MPTNKPELTLDDITNDISVEELDKYLTDKRVRDENPYVLDLIKVLYPHPTGLSRSIAIRMVEKSRAARGSASVEKPEHAIQSAYNRFCIDSAIFRKRKNMFPDEGIFHSPGGPGSGRWAIHRTNADAWLKRHGIRIR